MKKTLLLFVAIFASVCSLAVAEEQQDAQPSDTQKPDMWQEGARGEHSGMMGENKMGMKGGMMMGMHPTVVATSDGGVVVLTGGKLTKYDNGLNLIKEVEIKGGPKPMDKKSEAMEMKKPPMPPQDEPADQMSPEPVTAPASEGNTAKE